ncbi:MAG: HAD family phosphatase [Desulfurococcales archaeon]|nr:HAD family phosphatase [Desulfurococcales archaeon]
MDFLFSAKAFIFDLDGTLIDSVEAHIRSWINSFRLAAGVDIPSSMLEPLIGLSGEDIVRKILGKQGVEIYGVIRRLKDRFFLKELREGRVPPFPSAHKLLKLLVKSGFKVGIATSTPTYMATHILDFLGFLDYIDAYVCGDDVARGKPNPDIFDEAFCRLRVSPQEGVVVGDTLYDVVPAHRLGATAVLVNGHGPWRPRYSTLEDLTSEVVKVISEGVA